MRILILSHIYAPDRSPRAYRWTAIAERWAAEGKAVTVIAGWKPGDAKLEQRNGVTVERVGGGIIERLRALVGRRTHRSPGDGAAAAGTSSTSLLHKLYRRTLRRILWPDYAFHWYPAALAAARRHLAAHGSDALVTVSHPFTPHLVGLALKRRDPALRWVADIGDPFSLLKETPLNNESLYRGLNHRAEAAVLRCADAIAVTVGRCRTDYEAAFPESHGKIAIIPPLLSLPPPAAAAPAPFAGNGVHLACISTLYRELRHPGPLLALFAALRRRRDDLHLHFFGDAHDCADLLAAAHALLPERIHLHGMVPRETIAGVVRAAHLLVNIGNSTAYQLPSKLVEYAAAARPILNLAAIPGDSAESFLATYPAALTVPGTAEPTADTVEAVLRFIASPPAVEATTVERFLAPYRLDRIAADYSRLLAPGNSDDG